MGCPPPRGQADTSTPVLHGIIRFSVFPQWTRETKFHGGGTWSTPYGRTSRGHEGPPAQLKERRAGEQALLLQEVEALPTGARDPHPLDARVRPTVPRAPARCPAPEPLRGPKEHPAQTTRRRLNENGCTRTHPGGSGPGLLPRVSLGPPSPGHKSSPCGAKAL